MSRWITGTKAPVEHELEVCVGANDAVLGVQGSIPPTLNGRLVRMSPNPIGPVSSDYNYFTGAGMVHAVDLSNGRATKFTNRWVRTEPVATQLGETTVLNPVAAGVDIANTTAMMLAGKLMAFTETCPPYVLDEALRTVGRHDFGGGVEHFTAHPHIDPSNGEILGVGYNADMDPTCTLYVIDADGKLSARRKIDLLSARSVHDFAFTPNHVVVWDLPLEVDATSTEKAFPFAWNRAGAARVGVLSRHDIHSTIRWHHLDPCWVFHPLNAYETQTGIVVDVCQFDRIIDTDRTGPGDPFPPQLWRWTIDESNSTVQRELIDQRIQEFPRIDGRRWGQFARYGYTIEVFSRTGAASVICHDLGGGPSAQWSVERGHTLSEAIFVPETPSAGEGEGWLLTIDSTRSVSELIILDASNISDGPVARVTLPQRIPDGFHGDWVPSDLR
jgi:carotenoid cleavage dioxygenase-like enzyme